MASSQKGKIFFMIYTLFFFTYLHVSSNLVKSESCTTPYEHDQNPQLGAVSDPETTNHMKQQVLLDKLEELVRNLSEIVTRLGLKVAEPPEEAPVDERLAYEEKDEFTRRKYGKEVEVGGRTRDGERGRGVSVIKYTAFWSEKFQFVSAVKFDWDATCIDVLPFRDCEGLSKYVAVGDERGRVYIFLRNGDVLIEYYTSMESPITAMVSYTSVHKNESIVVTGHGNGAILMHRIWEGSSGEDWTYLFMENFGKVESRKNEDDDGLPINILEVHYVGRMKYILSTDSGGKIKVFRENGTFYGSVVPRSRPIAFLKQPLLFLTETGAGALDLRAMKVRESECEGLNHSLARNYVFDATERSKAYGFTSDGDLVYVLILGDVLNFKCKVRYKRKFEMDEPLALQAIKGYLLVVNREKVFVYNVSSLHYVRVGVPRLLFSSSLDEIRSSFLNYPSVYEDAERRVIPLIATDHEKLVIIGLGSGYVGIYHSNLPLFKGEFNTMLWTSPVMFFILFLFGAWHFFAKKKEALTSWGPDDPLSSTSATSGAPLGSNSGDRSFVDSSTRSSAEVMDLRSGALRGPTRFDSPTGYPGGGASSFRPSSGDLKSRPASVDPDFRTASDLKYRGSTMEPPGFSKRRDGLFVNNQVINDRS